MASYYSRKRSKWLWIKWYDELGIPHFESTNKLVRPNGSITSCPSGAREGERMAKKICDEIEAAKKLKIAGSVIKAVLPKDDEVTIKEAFIKYKKINQFRDKKTIYEHERFYKHFSAVFLPSSSCISITQDAVENWLLSIRTIKSERTKKPIKQNTIFNYQKNLKKFLQYLFEKKFIKIPFVISKDVLIEQIAGPKLIFRDEHIHRVLDGLEEKGSNFKMCVYLLTYTGLRPSDIINIPVDKIDFSRRTFEYFSKKGQEFRTIPIPHQIIPVIKERLKEVKSENLLDYTHYDAIGKAFSRYIRTDLKMDINYSPRTFRKSYDTWAYENGMDIVANSRLVGHSITTAERNYREVNIERLRGEQNKFKLPKKKKSRQNSDTN